MFLCQLLAEYKCRAADHDLTSYPALWHFIIQFSCHLLLTSLNQSMPLLYHNGGKCDLKFGYSVGVIELTNSDATYSVSLPTPPTGYNYDSYKTTITCVASTNGLAYTFFNVSVSDNICKFKVKCLSGDRYDGGLYLGVHAMMTNA